MKRNLMNELTEGMNVLEEKRKMERDRLNERLGERRERVNTEETFAPHVDEEQHINRNDLLIDYARIIDKQTEEIKNLHTELEYYRGFAEHLGAKKAVSQRDKVIKELEEIEQILGKALGYPWLKDDKKNFPLATEKDGVCVGDNNAWGLAMEAVDKIKELENSVASEYMRGYEAGLDAAYIISQFSGTSGLRGEP